MNADGSGQSRLTNGSVPECGQEWGAAWSPDGRKIAIVGNPMFPPPAGTPYTFASKIYVMNADGSGQRRLTGGTADFEESPAWSPDGRKIAFVRDGVYVVNADGSGERRLTRIRAAFRGLAWSPDGLKDRLRGGPWGRGRTDNMGGLRRERRWERAAKTDSQHGAETATPSGRPTGGGSRSRATGRSGL